MLKRIKPDYSPVQLLGGFLFRREASWEQRRNTINLLWAVATGLTVAGLMLLLMLAINSRK
jgi:hypothetical protein